MVLPKKLLVPSVKVVLVLVLALAHIEDLVFKRMAFVEELLDFRIGVAPVRADVACGITHDDDAAWLAGDVGKVDVVVPVIVAIALPADLFSQAK